MCINSPDTGNFNLDGDIVISHTTGVEYSTPLVTQNYVYLGNIITNDPVAKQAANNINYKESQLHKFNSFLRNNVTHRIG